jgi:hypothetical protein
MISLFISIDLIYTQFSKLFWQFIELNEKNFSFGKSSEKFIQSFFLSERNNLMIEMIIFEITISFKLKHI